MKLWLAPAGLHVEPASDNDASVLAKIHAQSFFKGWTSADMDAYIANPKTSPVYIACDAHHRIAGFMILRCVADEAELLTIAVAKKWQRKGIGAALMRAGLDDLLLSPVVKMFLEVDQDNLGAQKLYDQFGFARVAERYGYYTQADGRAATALVMRCNLN